MYAAARPEKVGKRQLRLLIFDLRRLQCSVPQGDKERFVTLLRVEGKVYCIDSTCYHAGGARRAGLGAGLFCCDDHDHWGLVFSPLVLLFRRAPRHRGH